VKRREKKGEGGSEERIKKWKDRKSEKKSTEGWKGKAWKEHAMLEIGLNVYSNINFTLKLWNRLCNSLI